MMLVSALVVLGMVSMSQADMMPCCSSMPPAQFSVGLQIVTTELKKGSTEPTVKVNNLLVEQDMTRNMTRYAGMISTYMYGMNTTYANYSVVNDFNMEKQYNFGMSDGHLYCTVNHMDMMKIKMPSQYCVPKNLTYHESVLFGSGDESVRVNSWDGMADGMWWSIQTTVDGCEPVSYNKFGMTDDGTMMTESGLYGSAVANLTMPEPFMVPPQCTAMTFNIGNLPGR